MALKYWHDGKCFYCGHHTHHRCDHCDRFICERDHAHLIKKGQVKIAICSICWKHVKPDVKVSGIKVTKDMLER